MGFFSSLIGWDKTMGAVNAVLASHLIDALDPMRRQQVAVQVAHAIQRVNPGHRPEELLRHLSGQGRVAQMNFIALACDDLRIPPSVPNNVWTRVKNPYEIAAQIDRDRIAMALDAVLKQDGVAIRWPGADVRVDFVKMYETGTLVRSNSS